MKFKGTILITDPCYLDHNSGKDLWFESSCGDDLSVFGCSQWISESTIYGDWSCHTYKGLQEEVQQNIEKWDTYYMNFFRKYNAKDVSQEERDKLLAEYRTFSKEFKAEQISLRLVEGVDRDQREDHHKDRNGEHRPNEHRFYDI